MRPRLRAGLAVFAIATSASTLVTSATASGAVLAVAFDFDGDGHPDLAVGAPGEYVAGRAGAGQVHIVFSGRHGLTSRDQLVNQRWRGALAPQAGEHFGAAVASADFNRDGYADLVATAPGHAQLAGDVTGALAVFSGSAHGLSQASGERQRGFGSQNGERFGVAVAVADFNGDGFPDLVVGSPGAAVLGQSNAGQAQIYLGGSKGVDLSAPAQTWSQGSQGLADTPEPEDRFGASLATGDFNGDGHADLAVGVPGETVANPPGGPTSTRESGAVEVLYGSPDGLTGAGSQVWDQNSSGVTGTADQQSDEDGNIFSEQFGAALAAADYNADGKTDLAVGVPDERVSGDNTGTPQFQGGVNVLFGSAAGITSAGNQYLTEATPGVPGDPAHAGHFGASVTAGDFNHDGRADLAIGAPSDPVAGHRRAGDVIVLPAGTHGLSAQQAIRLSQDTRNVPGHAELGDSFGWSLNALNLGRGRSDDLAVGAPGENEHGEHNAGAIDILYGASGGLADAPAAKLTEDTRGISDSCEPGDRFGSVSTTERRTAPGSRATTD